jgi:hypothetical protein
MPYGRPTPGHPIGCPGVVHTWGVFGVLVTFDIFVYAVHLIMKARPVREVVSTDSLKFHPAPPYPTLLRPAGGQPPPNGLMAVWGVACLQGGRPATVFFSLGYPFPYEPDEIHLSVGVGFVQRSRHVSLVVGRFHQHVDKVFVGIFSGWIP